MSYDPDKLYKLLRQFIAFAIQRRVNRYANCSTLSQGRSESWRKISSNFTTTNLSRPARHGFCCISAT